MTTPPRTNALADDALAPVEDRSPADETLATAVLTPSWRLMIETPAAEADAICDAIADAVGLDYAAYDRVAFTSAEGVQRFRPREGARAGAHDQAMSVACVVMSCHLPRDPAFVSRALTAAIAAHPYEEPVISMVPAWTTRVDVAATADAPAKWWNRAKPDWLPHDV